jgi:hypothetical protein
MEITLKSTDKVIYINGVATRVWEGETGLRVSFTALIARLITTDDAVAACGLDVNKGLSQEFGTLNQVLSLEAHVRASDSGVNSDTTEIMFL